MRLSRQLRELLFYAFIGPVMIVGVFLSIVYADEIEAFFNTIAQAVGKWVWL